jgi:hypothetical protein
MQFLVKMFFFLYNWIRSPIKKMTQPINKILLKSQLGHTDHDRGLTHDYVYFYIKFFNISA